MDPADTVDNFSSSFLPTPNPLSSNHSSFQPPPVSNIAGHGGVSLPELSRQFQQLLTATMKMQEQFNTLLMSGSSQADPVDPASLAADPVDPSADAVHFTSHPSSSQKTVHLKTAPPSNFDGSLAKSEDFLNSLELYFFGREGLIDQQKIAVALSFMKEGTASKWAKRKLKQLRNQATAPTWEQFVSDFKKSFSDPDPRGSARHSLELLKQGNSTADDYVSSFKELMDDTGYNDAALLDMFEKGLSKVLVDRIYSLPDLPETLEEWMSQALKFDRLKRRREERNKHASHPGSSATQSKPSPSSSTNTPKQTITVKPTSFSSSSSSSFSSSEVVPMEVDASRKRAGLKVCYKCRKPGHFARDCQSKLDINALDYSSLKAHFMKEIEEEKSKAAKESTSDTQDF